MPSNCKDMVLLFALLKKSDVTFSSKRPSVPSIPAGNVSVANVFIAVVLARNPDIVSLIVDVHVNVFAPVREKLVYTPSTRVPLEAVR